MMAKNTQTVVTPEKLQSAVAELVTLNYHLVNLVSLLMDKTQDEAESLAAAARMYLNEEFLILKRLQGDDSWDGPKGGA